MILIDYFLISMTSLFSSLIIVPLLMQWAEGQGYVDRPNERKIHIYAVPRIGGVAIFVSSLFSLLLHVEFTKEIKGVAAGLLVVFITGYLDDLYGLSPKKKFFGQIAASLITIFLGDLYVTNLGDLFGFGVIILPFWVAIPFTVFAVVGVCNAMNLIDGLDGLAGGTASIALAAFFLLAFHDGNVSGMILCAALFGSVLGFLKYNSYPARTFMGDAGSLVIGFLLAFIAILLTRGGKVGFHPVIPGLILGLPIFDTLRVMSRRVFRGENPFTPDKTHLHHEFLALGIQHRFTVIIIYGLSVFWCTVALFFHSAPDYMLFWSWVLLSFAGYSALTCFSRFREKISLFRKDSPGGIRKTVAYRNFCELLHATVMPLLTFCVIVSAAWSVFNVDPLSPLARSLSLLFLMGGGFLLYLLKDTANNFLMVFFFLVGFFIIFLMEQSPAKPLEGLPLVVDLYDAFFVLIAIFIALKILFRKEGEIFLTTPLDYLILAMGVSLALVSPGFDFAYSLSYVMAKAIILFVAIKILVAQGRRYAGIIFFMFEGGLLLMVLKSYP